MKTINHITPNTAHGTVSASMLLAVLLSSIHIVPLTLILTLPLLLSIIIG